MKQRANENKAAYLALKQHKALGKYQKKEVKQIVNKVLDGEEEHKQFSASDVLQSVWTGAGTKIVSLTSITQGDADNQRQGDEIHINSCHLRVGLFNNTGSGANPFVNFRVMIFQYKNSDMAPSVNQMFLTSNANNGNVAGTYSSRQIDYMPTYNVLYDKIVHTEQGTANASNFAPSGNTFKLLKIRVPMKYVKRKIQYQAAGANHTNGLWMLVTTDAATIASNPSFAYDVAVGYTDS